MQAPAIAGGGLDAGQALAVGPGQAVTPADQGQARAAVDQALRLGVQIVAQEPHQAGHLRRGAQPVVGRKREKGQGGDAEIGRHARDTAHGFGARPMAGGARQALVFGPAAIAIHDDGEVQAGAI